MITRAERSLAYEQVSAGLAAQALVELDGLSYEDYFKKVEEMVANMRQQWRLEQRVKALKVVIQLSKLLADTSQLKLYQKKYKLIGDTLDEFGRLIYKRIRSTADGEFLPPPPVSSSSSTDVTKQTTLDRLQINATSDPHLHGQYSPREKAKETCKNWFLKVASIRELVPRFYIELAILQTCDILLNMSAKEIGLTEEKFYSQSLERLTKAAWGFGDPIVAIHARTYLCRVAVRLIGWKTSNGDKLSFQKKDQGGDFNDRSDTLIGIILKNLEASVELTSRLEPSTVLRIIQPQQVDSSVFFELISSSFQTMIGLITSRFDIFNTEDETETEIAQAKLEQVFDKFLTCVRTSNYPSPLANSILLHSAFRALPGEIVANHSDELLAIIQSSHKQWQQVRTTSANDDNRSLATVELSPHILVTSSLYLLLASFALALDESDIFELPSASNKSHEFLGSINNILDDLLEHDLQYGRHKPDNVYYLRCFKAWISYANHYVKSEVLDTMLGKFLVKIKLDRSYVNQSTYLVDLIKTLAANRRGVEEFGQLFALKSFQQLIELLRKDDHKLEAARWTLETMRTNLKLNHQQQSMVDISISDRRMVEFLLKLFAMINDSISLLIHSDDIDHLSQLVLYFLTKISNQDYEQQLDFLSRCRSSLGNLNPVLEYLARRPLELALEFRKVVKKRSSRQNYLNGCLAFTFITTQAITNPLDQLSLFIDGSRVALKQMSLSLADYYIKQTLVSLSGEVNSPNPLHQFQNNPDHQSDIHGGESRSNRGLEFPKSRPKTISIRQLVEKLDCLLDLALDCEDHIDLKHKLVLTNLIKNSFSEDENLVKKVELLNVIKENGYDGS